VIARKTWDGIAPADQAVIRELALAMQAHLEQEIPEQDRRAIQEMARRGLTVTHPKDAQQTKAWDDTTAQFAAFMRRHSVPAEVFDQARQLRDSVRAGGR
jgi:TRAP-type C4-dicarboxylate transport system substrate-binding protein